MIKKMNIMNYKIKFLLLIFFGIGTISLFAQNYSARKKVKRNFKVTEETTLEITNKYGNIHLMPWEKDSVKITIDVEVRSNKTKKLNKTFEYIDFEFTNTPYYIIAGVKFSDNANSFIEEINDITNAIFSNNTTTQIDWFVYLPDDLEITIKNKFGNIYMTDHRGKVSIELSNGDFKANNFSNNLDLKLDFGNANINRIENAKISFSYGDFILSEARFLEFSSKSGIMDIGKLGVLELNSKRDRFTIDELSELKGTAYFTYITVREGITSADLNMEYGELNLENIPSNFTTLDIASNYGEILFETRLNDSYILEIDYDESTRLNLPADFEKYLSVSTIDKEQERYRKRGTLGKNSGKKIKVAIAAGAVTIKSE